LEHSSNLRVTVAIISNFGPTLKTASETEQSEWQQAVMESHSAEVAVEGTKEWPSGSLSMSAKYGYTNEQTHSEAFSNEVMSMAEQTFQQEIKTSITLTIPKRTQSEPSFLNFWTFKTDAIQKTTSGFKSLSNSLSDISMGIEMSGCGYDIPPNCLPGHCVDPNCWRCTDKKWMIDTTFVAPKYHYGWPTCRQGIIKCIETGEDNAITDTPSNQLADTPCCDKTMQKLNYESEYGTTVYYCVQYAVKSLRTVNRALKEALKAALN